MAWLGPEVGEVAYGQTQPTMAHARDELLAFARKDSSAAGWQMRVEQIKWLCYDSSHLVLPRPIPAFDVIDLYAASDSVRVMRSAGRTPNRNVCNSLKERFPRTQLSAGSGNHAKRIM
jgi:hypothetical protein